jgi:hypothetical protein
VEIEHEDDLIDLVCPLAKLMRKGMLGRGQIRRRQVD